MHATPMAVLKQLPEGLIRRLRISCLLVAGFIAVPSWALDATHARFTRLLADQVEAGRVDYAALKARPGELDAYLGELAAVTRPEFDRWEKPGQLAFLINLYNAATLHLIVENYPVKSIKDIGGFFKSPWKLPIVRLWGDLVTLDTVEHDLLRAKYAEPRLHFALVCAAKSCPPLRPEAYVGDRLDAQLNDQAKQFLTDPTKNRVDSAAQTLWLSSIFKWFEGDFTSGGKTLPEFVAPYLSEADRQALAAGRFKVRFTDYDWSLNRR